MPSSFRLIKANSGSNSTLLASKSSCRGCSKPTVNCKRNQLVKLCCSSNS